MSVLVLAVQKIVRTTKLPEGLLLFSCLGGLMDLLKVSFMLHLNGCKGMVKWAFMSTTSYKKVIRE
jgi:hypothetical protein